MYFILQNMSFRSSLVDMLGSANLPGLTGRVLSMYKAVQPTSFRYAPFAITALGGLLVVLGVVLKDGYNTNWGAFPFILGWALAAGGLAMGMPREKRWMVLVAAALIMAAGVALRWEGTSVLLKLVAWVFFVVGLFFLTFTAATSFGAGLGDTSMAATYKKILAIAAFIMMVLSMATIQSNEKKQNVGPAALSVGALATAWPLLALAGSILTNQP
jgi:hypothetical protein